MEDLQQQVDSLKNQLNQLMDLFYRQHFVDKDVFQNAVYLNGKLFFKDRTGNPMVISLGKVTGAQIGISATEKLGFLGATPVVQQSAITPPSGGATIDSQARTAINSLITLIQKFGLSA